MKLNLRKGYPAYPILIIIFLAAGAYAIQNAAGETISLVFAGDVMMDRYFRLRAEYLRGEEDPYAFVLPRPIASLEKADFAIANLEAPVSEKPSESGGTEYGTPENFLLRMDPAALKVLKRNGINILNTGNNHMGTFGEEGIGETLKHLDEAGFLWFGDNGDGMGENCIRLNRRGTTISLINYNSFTGDNGERAMKTLLRESTRSDVQIIYCHWGEEYSTEPSEKQKDLAKAFVKAGADLIVGSHPHVIQSSEMIEGVPVYYSLGNFIFDQYFSPETQKGLLLEVKIDGKGHIEEIREQIVTLRPDGATLGDSP